MQDFLEFNLVAGQVTGADIDPGYAVWGGIDPHPRELQIPFFPNIFKRQSIPKECIVCTEEKFEIDYGAWEHFDEACTSIGGSWTWTILEYPLSKNQQCTHPLDVCRLCVAKQISFALEDGRFESIICPQCDRVFTYAEIKELCHQDTFRK